MIAAEQPTLFTHPTVFALQYNVFHQELFITERRYKRKDKQPKLNN
ncbi:23213_t:CDS:1, partial [Rhizophagus irregularis]